MSRSVALLDIDDTLLIEDELNTALLESLKKNGVKDIFLFTDMTIKSTAIEERLRLKGQLEEQGFIVHRFITPLDLAWTKLDDDQEEERERVGKEAKNFMKILNSAQFAEKELHGNDFDSILSNKKILEQFPSYENALSKPLAQIRIGSAFEEATVVYNSDLHDGKEAESGFYLSHNMNARGDVAKLLGDQHASHEKYSHSKGLMLEAFMANKPEWVSSIIIADDNEKVIKSIEGYKTKKNPTIPISTIHVDKNNRNVDQYDHKVKTHLLSLEFARFQNNLKDPSKNQKEKELYNQGNRILQQVNIIAGDHPEDLSPKDLKKLTDVLICANATWNDRHDVERSKTHAQELAYLAQHVSGKSSPGWKALGIGLLTFACAALVVVGVLAAIPSGGSSLLLTAIGAAGLAATVGVGAGVAVAAGVGTGALIYSKEKGLAKSVNFFKEALCEVKAETSPFDVGKPNDEGRNILGDWNRFDAGPVTIDGVSIQKLIQKEKNLDEPPKSEELFNNENELKDFIKKYLLKNIALNQQDEALNQIIPILHQGGILNPVSGAAFIYFNGIGFAPIDARNRKKDIPGQKREINFKTTEQGFKIQEIVTQYRLANISQDNLLEILLPDPGNDYVYKAQATLNIGFSPNEDRNIEVESNTILYGNKRIEGLVLPQNLNFV